MDLGATFICHGADLIMVKQGMEQIQQKYAPLGFTCSTTSSPPKPPTWRRCSDREFVPATTVSIVGAGSIGERHARCFLGTGGGEVACVSSTAEKRRAVAERYGLTRAYTNWDESPRKTSRRGGDRHAGPSPHPDGRGRRSTAGLLYLIEKPLSVTLEGVANSTRGRPRPAGNPGRGRLCLPHPSGGSAMRDAVHSGRFGQPLQVENGPREQNFPFYRPAYRETYYTKHETGDGAVQDALSAHGQRRRVARQPGDAPRR